MIWRPFRSVAHTPMFLVLVHLLRLSDRPWLVALRAFTIPGAGIPFSMAAAASLNGDPITLGAVFVTIVVWNAPDLATIAPLLVAAGIGAIAGRSIRELVLREATHGQQPTP